MKPANLTTDMPPASGWYRVWLGRRAAYNEQYAAYWSMARLCWTKPYHAPFGMDLSKSPTPEENDHIKYVDPAVRHAWWVREESPPQPKWPNTCPGFAPSASK